MSWERKNELLIDMINAFVNSIYLNFRCFLIIIKLREKNKLTRQTEGINTVQPFLKIIYR